MSCEFINGCRAFRNCKIAGVYTKENTEKRAYNEFLIEIKIEEDGKIPKYEYLHITRKYGLYKELQDLRYGKRECVYGTYGMGNIDICRNSTNYTIEWSPMDGVYDLFEFQIQDFEQNFISALAPQCCKNPEDV